MASYRSNEWQRLAIGRAKRAAAKSARGPHPLAHVDPDRSYEWMRADCSAHDLARQAREDGLIASIIQISSAALLAIPGLIFGSDSPFPSFFEAPILYVGIIAFLVTLFAAMVEQVMSGKGYERQKLIAYSYYTGESHKRDDAEFVRCLRWVRRIVYTLFGLAIVLSMLGLSKLEIKQHGQAAVTSTAFTSTAAASAKTKPTNAGPAL